jgi:hypothetical protein
VSQCGRASQPQIATGPSPPAARKPRPSGAGAPCLARLTVESASSPPVTQRGALAWHRGPTAASKRRADADRRGRHRCQQRRGDEAQTQTRVVRHVHALQRLPLDGSADATLDSRYAPVKYLYTPVSRSRPGRRHLGISYSGAAHPGRAHTSAAGFANDALVRLGDRTWARPSVAPRIAADHVPSGRVCWDTP